MHLANIMYLKMDEYKNSKGSIKRKSLKYSHIFCHSLLPTILINIEFNLTIIKICPSSSWQMNGTTEKNIFKKLMSFKFDRILSLTKTSKQFRMKVNFFSHLLIMQVKIHWSKYGITQCNQRQSIRIWSFKARYAYFFFSRNNLCRFIIPNMWINLRSNSGAGSPLLLDYNII